MIFNSTENTKRFWEDFPEAAKQHAIDFQEFISVGKGYSIHTAEAYLSDLKFFLIFCSKESINYLQVTPQEIRSYFASLNIQEHLDKKSQSRKLSSLRSFYKYLFQNELIPENPILQVRFPKTKKTIPKNFSPNEMSQILDGVSEEDLWIESRNLALLEVFYSTGMRVFELVNCKWDHLSSDLSEMKILGKRNKERYVFLGESARKALEDYKILSTGKFSNGYIFLNFRGFQLTTRGVQFILEKMQKKMGMEKKITPHKFRHTFATDLLNEGADIRHVQELLGHKSLSSTQIYLSVSKERLKEIYRKSHPHAKLKEDE